MDTRVRDRDGALSEDEQLGVVLVKSGIISVAQLGEALGRAKERGCNLARVLIEDKLLTEEQFVATLAEQLGLEFVDLATYPVDPAAAQLSARRSGPALPGHAHRLVGGPADRGHGGPVQRVRHRRHTHPDRRRGPPGGGYAEAVTAGNQTSTTARHRSRATSAPRPRPARPDARTTGSPTSATSARTPRS